MAQLFDQILAKGARSGQMPARTKRAREWYRKQAQRTSKAIADPEKILAETSRRNSTPKTKFEIGSMYMFSYDAKHKDTLPYYDQFPLIFPINIAKGGLLGINMHYLPPLLRAKLMDALYTVSTDKRYDENTKIALSYDILNGSSKFKEFKPTIKHYLSKQIKSRLIDIAPAEWDIALFLPTARFAGASNAKVWADSRKIIRGR